MKKILFSILVAFSVFTVSEAKKTKVSQSAVSEQTVGDIVLRVAGKVKAGKKVEVSFSRIPETIEEFEEVRAFLCASPAGAIALQVMAMEMYRKDAEMGTKAIEKNNITTNVNFMTRRLHELMGRNDSYSRPYQAAAFLKGADPSNGYNPSKPYTVVVELNPSVPSQYSNDYQAEVLYFQIYTTGSDSGKRGNISVVKTLRPGEPQGYAVDNSPCLVSQVREKSFAAEFKGL